MMKKKVLLIVAITSGFAVATYVAYWIMHLRHVESTDNAYLKADNVVISPKISGYIAEVTVRDNQQVNSGQVLVRIEPSDYRTKLEQQSAAARAQEAALVTLDRQKSLQRSQIAQAEAALRAVIAQSTKAAQDYERDRALMAKGFATKEQLDTSRSVAEVAAAGVIRSKAELQAARDQLAVTAARETQIKADLEQSLAVAKAGQLDLNHATLVAPINGVVGNKAVEVGQYVRAGTQLMTVVPLNKVYVVANFKETQVKNMRPGQKAKITVDAFSGTALEGVIDSLAPATGSEFSLLPPENATGNFTKIVQRVPVKIALPSNSASAQNMRPGMSVAVTVDTRTDATRADMANNENSSGMHQQ
jgi:membrane fusion protein (multidrug efflux system)